MRQTAMAQMQFNVSFLHREAPIVLPWLLAGPNPSRIGWTPFVDGPGVPHFPHA